jgi:hypothetical protein
MSQTKIGRDRKYAAEVEGVQEIEYIPMVNTKVLQYGSVQHNSVSGGQLLRIVVDVATFQQSKDVVHFLRPSAHGPNIAKAKGLKDARLVQRKLHIPCYKSGHGK